jgi:hypothetical protein
MPMPARAQGPSASSHAAGKSHATRADERTRSSVEESAEQAQSGAQPFAAVLAAQQPAQQAQSGSGTGAKSEDSTSSIDATSGSGSDDDTTVGSVTDGRQNTDHPNKAWHASATAVAHAAAQSAVAKAAAAAAGDAPSPVDPTDLTDPTDPTDPTVLGTTTLGGAALPDTAGVGDAPAGVDGNPDHTNKAWHASASALEHASENSAVAKAAAQNPATPPTVPPTTDPTGADGQTIADAAAALAAAAAQADKAQKTDKTNEASHASAEAVAHAAEQSAVARAAAASTSAPGSTPDTLVADASDATSSVTTKGARLGAAGEQHSSAAATANAGAVFTLPAVTATTSAAATPAASEVMTANPNLPLHGQLSETVVALNARGNGTHVMVVEVHPRDLGPVQVQVRIQGDTTSVTVSGGQIAHETLRAAMPSLHQELRDAGLHNLVLNLGSPSDSSSWNNNRPDGASQFGAFDGLGNGSRGEHQGHGTGAQGTSSGPVDGQTITRDRAGAAARLAGSVRGVDRWL